MKINEPKKQANESVFPTYNNQYFFTLSVKIGYSNIVRISDEHVAKIPTLCLFDNARPEFDDVRTIQTHNRLEEYEKVVKAYEAGISVPKPEGVFNVAVREKLSRFFKPVTCPAFVMRYIRGVTLDQLLRFDKSSFSEALKQRDEEFDKARNLGFMLGDHEDHRNTIWSSEEKKIYLIDLVHWEVPK